MASIRFRSTAAYAALLAVAVSAPEASAQSADAPLPNPPEFPFENPLLPGQDILGKFLFWEEQMSHDGTTSCGTCHIHEAGSSDPRTGAANANPGPDGIFGNDDDVFGSPGVVLHDTDNNFLHDAMFGAGRVQVTGRKSPPAINAVYFNELFWDGRATQAFTDPQTGLVEVPYLGALEHQASGPPLSTAEMGAVNQTWDDVVDRLADAVPGALMTNLPPEMVDFLADYPTYPDMVEAVYGTPDVTSKRTIFAIANYERTLISDETVLDDFLKDVIQTFPPEYDAGFQLFQGDANCAACHTLPFTMNNDFHNVAVRPDAEDQGRFNVTGDPADIGKFKTQQIRNAALRGNLFHNGRFETVRDLLEFYDRGGDFPGPNTDPQLLVLNLTEQELDDLEFFIVDGMTDQRVVNNIFPFTRPTLNSELASLNSQYGVVSTDGNGGEPELIGHQPAFPGNQNFTIGVRDAVPNANAILLLAFAPDLAGTPFPDPRYPVPVNVDLGTLILDFGTTTDADGIASFNLPLPQNPIFSGMKFYSQWFVEDATALATGGVYGSKGLEVEIL